VGNNSETVERERERERDASRRLAMDNRCWYEADALFEDLTICRHVILDSSEEKVK